MEIQLGKGWLLLHHHHRSTALLHHLELFLLVSHLLLMLELDLVVSLQFLFSVAPLEVELNLNIASVGVNSLLFRIAGFLSLLSRYISRRFSTLLGLE